MHGSTGWGPQKVQGLRSRATAEGMKNKSLSLCPRDTTPLTTVSSLKQETLKQCAAGTVRGRDEGGGDQLLR